MPWITLKTLLCLVNFSNFPLPSQDLIKHLSNLNGESLFVQAQFSPAESSDNLQPFDGMSKWVWKSDIWFNHLFDPIWFPFIWLQMHRQGAWQKRMIITLEKKKRDLHAPDLATPGRKKIVSDWPEHYLGRRPGNQAALEQYNWELSRGDLWLGAAQVQLGPDSKHSTGWPFVTGLPDNLEPGNQNEVQEGTVDQLLNWLG